MEKDLLEALETREKSLLRCNCCKEVVINQKILTCHHGICLPCLKKLPLEKNGRMKCPMSACNKVRQRICVIFGKLWLQFCAHVHVYRLFQAVSLWYYINSINRNQLFQMEVLRTFQHTWCLKALQMFFSAVRHVQAVVSRSAIIKRCAVQSKGTL